MCRKPKRELERRLFLICAVMAGAMASSVLSGASGMTTKIGDDGKIYVVERPGPFRSVITCGSLKAGFIIHKSIESQPSVMAVVGPLNNSSVMPFRLMSEFDNYLDTHHMMEDFQIGCLSGGGGVGMIFETSDPMQEPAYIQMDMQGRIHPNFNQTGFVLETPAP